MTMETASFSGVVRVLIIIILSYYAIKFLIKIFAPIILQQVVKKAGQHMYEKQQEFQNRADAPQPAPPTREKKKVGEYIDYEEIE